ncbi:hypothetical protein J2S17_004060 [Cytobacillus purgationiresistens]|uniref:Uncharacterized protein n=1 Tax=Cytobacillus purgationiresistens TaxID=863449 RepID=A0ABU0ALM0_9BACI|nr:hypothetical protein [Cytobacillus purgationiresistens]
MNQNQIKHRAVLGKIKLYIPGKPVEDVQRELGAAAK